MSASGYYPVVYGEHSGWVSTELVQMEMRTEPAAAASFDQSKLLPEGMATLVESVNLRTGPGAEHDAVRVVDAGTQIEATGEISGAYEKVKVGSEEGGCARSMSIAVPSREADDLRQAEIMAAAVAAGHPLVTAGLSMVTDAEIVLRAGPSSTSQKVDVVPVNSKLTLTGNQTEGFLEATIRHAKRGGWHPGICVQAAPPAGPPRCSGADVSQHSGTTAPNTR